MNKRETGSRFEERACACLEDAGLRVLETNYRTPLGEIDIVAREGRTLVFVEVKYRKNSSCGGAAYAIPRKKQQTIIRVAQMYLKMHRLPLSTPCRFDAVLFTGNEYRHIRNAWQAW